MKDIFNRIWITDNAVRIIEEYGTGELTLRALHYRLVGAGMTNTMQHYKRVVKSMELARWAGVVPFDTFSDLDRAMIGNTQSEETILSDKVEQAKEQLKLWMSNYNKNRWENQPYYAEVFIEKKALQMVFQKVCNENGIALGACKGYPSLTFLHEAANRFKYETYYNNKECVILYFGDYDPSGEDIPRSIQDNLRRMGADVEVKRFALFEEQVRAWNLPPAPAKTTDSRTANWDGIGQVELDAVDMNQLKAMAQDAINTVFDYSLLDQLNEIESFEKEDFRTQLKEYAKTL